MADPRHALGLAAEERVASWLQARGWVVHGRRLRTFGGGEVDLLATDPTGALVAIEVRARRSRRAGSGAESVDTRRIARLRRSLGAIGARGGVPHRGLRVDLVSVEPIAEQPGRWRLRRLPGIG